jgi:lipopolysaccharide assembly outer membrane protein LptD (OstA)
MGGSTITVDDPAGRWHLDATSPHVVAAGIGGPFRLEPATCRYQQQGHPPVLMRAATAVVDKAASRLALKGKVHVVYGALTLEAERIEYDLKRGEVVAGDRTKLTYAQPSRSSRSSPNGKNGGPR